MLLFLGFLLLATMKRLLLAAGLMRLVFVAYGEWQDAHLEVPYTDIDYTVFSDAAALMAQGKSPYLRSTYRYSPLLALILLPNIWIHGICGKLLFSIADVLVGYLVHRLLRLRNVPQEMANLCTAAWLFNPFTFTVATRGNCEAIPCAMVLWITICLVQGRRFEAALWYGLVVHFRIYPLIYALPMVLYLAPSVRGIVNRKAIAFGCVSAAVFCGLTAAFYKLYGMEFLNEALLYHVTRTDPRHNFSIYFYSIYLHQGSSFTMLERLASFIPQVCIQLVLAACFSKRDLPFTLFVQTLAFVALNKVVTAQYFVWFFCLLPLVLPFTTMQLKWKGGLCIGVWVAAQLHWLGWAYLLEFRGRNVFLQLWLASVTFLAANVYVLAMLLLHHHSPAFTPHHSR